MKTKKYNKDYKQLEVFCDDCQCNVKKYRWSRHLQTEKHKQNETVKNDETEKLNDRWRKRWTLQDKEIETNMEICLVEELMTYF